MSRATLLSRRSRLLFVLAAISLTATCGHDRGDPLRIAVATNFARPLATLVAQFEQQTGNVVAVSPGSSGKLFAQIQNGAPYDVLLSADQERPARLVANGQAVPGSQFTYALGILSLWSRNAGSVSQADCALQVLPYDRIAIANPDLAPYGRAARAALQAAGSWDSVREKIVQGENVGQAFALIATGNAEIGLIAKSYVVNLPINEAGSHCEIPAAMHAGILQDAVLLQRAAGNGTAIEFLRYLRSDRARQLINAAGYGVT